MSVTTTHLEAAGLDMELFHSTMGSSGLDDYYY
jgi:hypothetical protein